MDTPGTTLKFSQTRACLCEDCPLLEKGLGCCYSHLVEAPLSLPMSVAVVI